MTAVRASSSVRSAGKVSKFLNFCRFNKHFFGSTSILPYVLKTNTFLGACIVFLKIQFAMSVLAVPGALATLGAVGGGLSIVGWEVLNTYTAVILGDFRNRHPECHSELTTCWFLYPPPLLLTRIVALADMCGLMWGRIGKELVGFQILVAQVLITAAGIVSCSTAFNALSEHGACTVAFSFVSAVLITIFSSVRTFSRLGWLTWLGFTTFFIAVFIFVVAVTQQDRPAAAPPTGDFDLGWAAISHPGFVAGILASANIFLSGSGSQMVSNLLNSAEFTSSFLILLYTAICHED